MWASVKYETASFSLPCVLVTSHNKKVLLRERKRHTACRVASARFAYLSPYGGGGAARVPNQSWMGMGTPSILIFDGVTPHLSAGWGTPHLDLRWGTPYLDLGWGTPCPDLGWGTPPPRKCGHTENITLILRLRAVIMTDNWPLIHVYFRSMPTNFILSAQIHLDHIKYEYTDLESKSVPIKKDVIFYCRLQKNWTNGQNHMKIKVKVTQHQGQICFCLLWCGWHIWLKSILVQCSLCWIF